MKFALAGGWHLERIEVCGVPEWIVTDPEGDRLGGTEKHMRELDAALMSAINRPVEMIYDPGPRLYQQSERES